MTTETETADAELFDLGTLPDPEPPVSDKQLQKWADGVTRWYRKHVANVVAIGHELNRIKAKCPHGSFERLFKGHEHPVATPIPFGIRTAEMYMAIAKHPILSKTCHGALLPSSQRTLYELTRLPSKVITQGLKNGLIHPDMERQEVSRLQPPQERSGRMRMPFQQPRLTLRSQSRKRGKAQRVIHNTLQRLWRQYPEEHDFFLREVHDLATNAGRLIPEPLVSPDLSEQDLSDLSNMPDGADQETKTA